jgi:hypothetical protein
VLADGLTVPVELLIERPAVELNVPPDVPEKLSVALVKDLQYGDAG